MDPFYMDQYSEEELSQFYKDINHKIDFKSSHSNVVSENIDWLVELKSICGEVANRVLKLVNDMSMEVKNKFDTTYYEERTKWINKETKVKTPPADYFKSLARKEVHEEELKLNEMRLKLKRFRNTYSVL